MLACYQDLNRNTHECILINIKAVSGACKHVPRHERELGWFLPLCFHFTHTLSSRTNSTHTPPHKKKKKKKIPVSLLQRSEWFCSQLSHITGEERVHHSVKELFNVLWWFKANISLAHSYWTCSSKEQALDWVRMLLLRFKQCSVGATRQKEGGRIASSVEMEMDRGCL